MRRCVFALYESANVGVLGNPLFPCDGKIEGVKTNRNNRQQKPKQDATPKLESVAIKCQSVTVDVGVSLLPLQHSASAEGSSDTQSDYTQKREQNASAKVPPKTACKSRHTQNPLSKNNARKGVHNHCIISKSICQGSDKKFGRRKTMTKKGQNRLALSPYSILIFSKGSFLPNRHWGRFLQEPQSWERYP